MQIDFDIATTCIPRLMTFQNVSSFLNCMVDRNKYRFRWLCHLENYSGMETNFDQNAAQVIATSERFLSCHLIIDRSYGSFGRAVHRLMNQVERNVLWIEDDWEWVKDFRLGEALELLEREKGDCFNFKMRREQAGALCPTYWSYDMVKHLREHWPGDEGLTEPRVKRVLRRKFHTTRGTKIPQNVCVERGRDYLRQNGFSENHAGTKL